MMFKRATYGLLFMLLGTAVWGSASAAGAAAPASKPYSAVICPTTDQCGPGDAGFTSQVDDVEFKATLKNLAKEQSIGSANIIAPEYFDLVANSGRADRSGVTVVVDDDNRLVKVRNANIAANGGTLQVYFKADLARARGFWPWGVDARQSNNFEGDGNAFRLDTSRSQLVTEVENEEEGATVGCESDVVCQLSIAFKGNGVPPTPDPRASSSGAASFATASALDSTAEPFTIRMDVAAFPILAVNSGTLSAALPAARTIECEGATYSLPAVGRTTGPQNRRKEVRFTIDYTSALSGRPRPICFGAPYVFESDVEVAAPTVQLPSPNGSDQQPLFVGVLLDCSRLTGSKDVTPCMRQRFTDASGNWVILIDVPGTLPDPYYR